MSEAEAAAQAELPHIVDRLTAVRSQLRQIVESLSGDPGEEASSLGEDEMDVTTEVRSIIECVLNDSIQPAIRDLRVAAAYRVKSRGRGRRTLPLEAGIPKINPPAGRNLSSLGCQPQVGRSSSSASPAGAGISVPIRIFSRECRPCGAKKGGGLRTWG